MLPELSKLPRVISPIWEPIKDPMGAQMSQHYLHFMNKIDGLDIKVCRTRSTPMLWQ